MDLTIGGASLILISPLLAAIALWILLDSGRPVLFRQRRAGRDGVPFTVLKFRTMVQGAEEQLGELVDLEKLDEPAFKIADDPRITRVGRRLRRYSLDELPQFINVVRGEMSLVGPRPALPSEVECYDEVERRRLDVLPGLTGLWQVSGRSDLGWDSGMALDLRYADNWRLRGDASILARTVTAVLRRRGAY
jgi:lipopolysaccharide/colanic/teichoic acid biosynthesis glycosyltransferase